MIATSLTGPAELNLPFGNWTLDRLAAYLQETKGLAIGRSRIGEILRAPLSPIYEPASNKVSFVVLESALTGSMRRSGQPETA